MSKVTTSYDVEAVDPTASRVDQAGPFHPVESLEISTPSGVQWGWNEPKSNIFRLGATYWCFILLGSNDASYGFLIPHLEDYYHASYLTVSLLFLSPLIGYVLSTGFNHPMHLWVGQRGVAIIAGACHIIAYVIISVHPPFPVLVVVYILIGLGSGAKAGAWNAFVGGLKEANEALGLLHGFYGLGATLSPTIGTLLITKRGWQWYRVFYLFIGMAVLDIILSFISFRHANGQAYRDRHEISDQNSVALPTDTPSSVGVKSKLASTWTKIQTSQVAQCLTNKIVLMCSIYLLLYVGSEVALGGWLVTFMVRIRHGTLFASGIVSSGFWAGLTIGRMTLGFVTGRFFKNERQAVALYLCLVIVFQLLFWLIPNFLASAITVAILGFFLGPLFPGVIVCLSKSLPKAMVLPSISTISAIGAIGGSLIPFAVGAIAQARGVQVLQPIILSGFCVCLVIWILLPGFRG